MKTIIVLRVINTDISLQLPSNHHSSPLILLLHQRNAVAAPVLLQQQEQQVGARPSRQHFSTHQRAFTAGALIFACFSHVLGKASEHTREAKQPTPLVTSRGDGGGDRPSTQPVGLSQT
jgi:hypothetical protein